MKTLKQIMKLVDTYGSECCSGNEYDNRYAEKRARDAVVSALKEYAPQRTWVGLTDEEVDECYFWKDRQWTTDELVRHVEAKLRSKNT